MRYLFTGILFGFILVKTEVISWFRIQEMFLFDSIHMYGIFATAILVGYFATQLIKSANIKAVGSTTIKLSNKDNSTSTRYIAGGTIFGLGWAFTGACPGPIYALIGGGFLIYVVPLLAAVTGAALYGVVQKKLPH
jgi:hypothetical protein